MFNDNYDIDEQYQNLKKLVVALEKDLYSFLGPARNKTASIRTRKLLRKISKTTNVIRKCIIKQRQDNSGEY